jgi:glycine/D-amino acid oxidase-like deaminating enzyme
MISGSASSSPRVVVVGAGAFGGWTALTLVRRGARVTLVDAWGPANSRASSGDETRLIRGMYNGDPLYTAMVARAFARWREEEKAWRQTVLLRTGALYFFLRDDSFARKSLPVMSQHGIAVEALNPQDAAARFPQIGFEDLRVAYFEPEAGVLRARVSCELVRDSVEREGGAYREAQVRPGRIEGGRLVEVLMGDGGRLEADAYVFACGPWLGRIFPNVIGDGIVATRQAVMYFGTPAGDRRFDWRSLPGWMDFGEPRRYGMASGPRGVKIGEDTPGPAIDPTTLERVVSPEEIGRARDFLKRRFPLLADQPIIETRVCQYEYSPEGDFLLDSHPEASNVWLVGGGSGHGFKMGPALGEYVARLVLDGAKPDQRFSYANFAVARARTVGVTRQPHS